MEQYRKLYAVFTLWWLCKHRHNKPKPLSSHNNHVPNKNCVCYLQSCCKYLEVISASNKTWQSCVIQPCSGVLAYCSSEWATPFWSQKSHWVTESTHCDVSIFNLLSSYCSWGFCAPSSRVGSAGCGTTRFGSRQNLPSWREISTTPRPSTVVRPPSVSAPLPPWVYVIEHT